MSNNDTVIFDVENDCSSLRAPGFPDGRPEFFGKLQRQVAFHSIKLHPSYAFPFPFTTLRHLSGGFIIPSLQKFRLYLYNANVALQEASDRSFQPATATSPVNCFAKKLRDFNERNETKADSELQIEAREYLHCRSNRIRLIDTLLRRGTRLDKETFL